MKQPKEGDKRTEKRKLGDIGETIACDYLIKHGFVVLDRNYLRKWGEIDIVAKKGALIRFIEVKSIRQRLENVSHVTNGSVTYGTDVYRPEENVHPGKLRRLTRALQTYLLEKRIDLDWQLDLVTVKIDESKRTARVEMIENIIAT